jgi:glycosyltransferase involved in cell wall biosynthesis
VRVRSLNKKGRWDTLSFFMRFIAMVREEAPDIIYSYLEGANIIATFAKPLLKGKKVVWGVRSAAMDMSLYDRTTQIVYRIQRWASQFADMIITNSHSARDHACALGFPEEKIVVVPNGIDTNRFRPDPAARQRIRTEWGVPDDVQLIGIVGRFDPIKGHRVFLRAAAQYAKQYNDAWFVCVGDSTFEFREQLHILAEELHIGERLVWAGSRNDMAAVYNGCDIVTSASYSESFPNVLAEAMACGVVCVATNVGDSAWIVGDTGVIIPPKSVEEMIKAWRSVIVSTDTTQRERARERIIEHCNVDALCRKTLDVLVQGR